MDGWMGQQYTAGPHRSPTPVGSRGQVLGIAATLVSESGPTTMMQWISEASLINLYTPDRAEVRQKWQRIGPFSE